MKKYVLILFSAMAFLLLFPGCANTGQPQIKVANNTTEFMHYVAKNCTPAKYFKQRDSYEVYLEILGPEKERCKILYNYTPKSSGNASAMVIPSKNPMNNVCPLGNTSEQSMECSIEFASIMVAEGVAEKFEEKD